MPLAVCLAAAALYALGGRGRAEQPWRAVAFYSGLGTVAFALEPPMDGWSDTWFSVHMAQHVLLLTVAPPLLVLGRPWPRLYMPLPLAVRRGIAVVAGTRPLRFLTRPLIALVLMSAALALWHVPALYDAAVGTEWVHVLEHLTFVVTALLFWAPILGTPPLRTRIDRLRQAAYLALAMLPGWVLAVVLAFSSTPLYAAYEHRAGGLSALGDQQLAAGVMWVPGSLSYLVALVVAFYRWLDPQPRAKELSWT